MSYVFAGYPPFLREAARLLNRPEEVATTRPLESLTIAANLCGQASEADLSQVKAILDSAASFGADLRSAALAVELMVADVRAGRGLDSASPPSEAAANRALPPEPSRPAPHPASQHAAQSTNRERHEPNKHLCVGRGHQPKGAR